jgi:hypothetical protein
MVWDYLVRPPQAMHGPRVHDISYAPKPDMIVTSEMGPEVDEEARIFDEIPVVARPQPASAGARRATE